MKELSIEEKAKRYDKAIERAKSVIEQNPLMEYLKKGIEYILPELRESDDEKIRKALVRFHKSSIDIDGIKGEDILAWLEKQGDKVSAIEGFETEFERQVSGLIASAINKEHEYNEGYVKWTANALLNYAKHELEKQGEQKPVNIVTILNDYFANTPKEQQDKDWEELKHLNNFGEFVVQKPTDKVEPKFKVKYAGSEYNVFEIKEIAGVTYYGIEDETIHIDYVKAENCEIVSEHNPAWSEEDENKFKIVINALVEDYEATQELINWFKSLKGRVQLQSQWKPSDEQIEALLKLEEMHVLEHEKNQENAHLYMVVKSIREQLLKLREE